MNQGQYLIEVRSHGGDHLERRLFRELDRAWRFMDAQWQAGADVSFLDLRACSSFDVLSLRLGRERYVGTIETPSGDVGRSGLRTVA